MGGPAVSVEAVLEAAWSLLDERGAEAVSIRSVAQRAGCSTMPIYSNFGDKQGLFDALVERFAAETLASLQALPSQGSPRQRCRAIARAFRERALRHAPAYCLLSERLGRPKDAPDAEGERFLSGLARLFAAQIDGVPESGTSPGGPEENAAALCHGRVVLELGGALASSGPQSAERLEDAVEALLAPVVTSFGP